MREFLAYLVRTTNHQGRCGWPAGHIVYALPFRIASGKMLGPDQPLKLHLIEIPAVLGFT